MTDIDPLDLPVRGARAIAEVANLRDKEGKLSPRIAYYYLQNRVLDADKMGHGKKTTWWSTPRRLLKIPR
jgi:hypothetical protein